MGMKKLKSGKIQLRYILDGKKLTASFPTKKAAEEFKCNLKMRRFTQHLVARKKISEALTKFRENEGIDQMKVGEVRRISLERLEDHLLNYDECRLMFIDEIKRSHLLLLRERLLKIPLSNSSANCYMRLIRAFLQYCVEMDWIQVNPGASIRGLPQSTQKRKIWTQEQQNIFIESFGGWMREMLFFFRYTGIRPVSITRLTWADFNEGSGFITARSYKSRGGAEVVSNHHLLPGLIDFLRAKRAKDQAAGFGCEDHFIFHREGRQIVARVFCQTAHQRIKQFEAVDDSFKGLMIYAFRHTFVSHIGNQRGLSVASKVIGHRSISTTERFYFKENEKVLADALNQSFSGMSADFNDIQDKSKILKFIREAK